MRLLVFDEELIAGGVETLRIHLLPQLALRCETLVWVLPAYGGKELAAQLHGIPNLVLEPMNWPSATPHGFAQAVLRRVKTRLPQDCANAAELWLREARIHRLIRRHRCTHFLTTCVFSQTPPRTGVPFFGFVCDVNPALPEPIRRNIASWVQAASGIFAISEFTRGELLRMNPSCAAKIHTLSLAVPPLKTEVLESEESAFDFYCPAAANPHKNHLTLFRACVQLAEAGIDFRLALSGPGTDGFSLQGHFDNAAMQEARDFLLQHSNRLGSRIVVLGPVAPGEVAAIFDRSLCVVLPSGYEGFGLPLAEALMNGLPVICSDIPAFQEQLDLYDARDDARIVAVGDSGQMAAAMEDFLKNKSLRPPRCKNPDRMARWTWADAGRRCFELLSASSGGASSPGTPVDVSCLRRSTTGLGARIRWHLNHHVTRQLRLLDFCRGKLTVFDVFGSPGDTLLTAIVCRHIKERFPNICLNLLTPNPDLVRLDPCLENVNAPETFFCVWHWYLDLIDRKDSTTNMLHPTLTSLGINDYEYRARVYLAPEELAAAGERLKNLKRPIISINSTSREKVKIWPTDKWREVIRHLTRFASVVQLGDQTEPEFESVHRFAGKLSMRESMAVLAHSTLHIGSPSFLMHVANGVNVPAVIIYGGRETPANSGYPGNENLYTLIECGPCWIHDSRGQVCPHDIVCMERITPQDVLAAVERKLPQWRGTEQIGTPSL